VGRPLRTRNGTSRPDNLSVVYVRASRDGRKIAASVHNPEKGGSEIWVYDTQSKVNRVLVPAPESTTSQCGRRMELASLYSHALGSGRRCTLGLANRIARSRYPVPIFRLASDWSRDGRFALFNTENVTDGNIGVIDLKTRKLTWLWKVPHTKSARVLARWERMAFVCECFGAARSLCSAL
jgi:hypothetical protein